MGSREKILYSSYLYRNSLFTGSPSLYKWGEANIPLEFFQQFAQELRKGYNFQTNMLKVCGTSGITVEEKPLPPPLPGRKAGIKYARMWQNLSYVTEKANLEPVLSVSTSFIGQHFAFILNFHSVVTDLCSQHWVSIKLTAFSSTEPLELEKTFSHDKSLYGEK